MRGAGLAMAVVAVVAGALRCAMPEARQLHHDEGVNYIFVDAILTKHEYRYDPSNYHGPALYALAAPLVDLMGASELSLRLVPMLASWLTVLLIWRWRGVVGDWGAVMAAALLAVSPGTVYYGRDFIHESLLVLFTTAFATYALGWLLGETAAALALASLAAALALATKETFPMSVLALAAGALLAACDPRGLSVLRRGLERLASSWRALAASALAAAAVLALLMSSLGTNPRGLVDFFRAYLRWTQTGVEGATGHEKPFAYYAEVLMGQEPVLTALALAGLVLAALERRAANLGLGGWCAALFLLYSLVPYKTPWLVLSMLVPMALLAGLVSSRALEALETRAGRVALAAVSIGLAGIAAHAAVGLSFRRHDDETIPYVYSQTHRQLGGLLAVLEQVAASSGEAGELAIAVTSPDHFPLNFYLRRYKRAVFWQKLHNEDEQGVRLPLWDTRDPPPVIIARADQLEELKGLVEPSYRRQSYALRPGVELVLLVRDEAARKTGEAAVWPALDSPPDDAGSASPIQ